MISFLLFINSFSYHLAVSVSSQGNATWVILATTDTRRRSRKMLYLLRWSAQTRARGVRIIKKHSIFCSENTGHNYLFKIKKISCSCFVISRFTKRVKDKGSINCFAKKRCEIFKGEKINWLLSPKNACYHYLFETIEFFLFILSYPLD